MSSNNNWRYEKFQQQGEILLRQDVLWRELRQTFEKLPNLNSYRGAMNTGSTVTKTAASDVFGAIRNQIFDIRTLVTPSIKLYI